MYRLISAKNLYQNSVHNVCFSRSKSIKYSNPEYSCSFCRKTLTSYGNLGNVVVVRHQSTRPVLHKSKKVKYKNTKRYGELLQVSDKSMTEMKVSINKLHANQLSKLASSPVSLGQLHQLTTRNKDKTMAEVDMELLQSIKNKILKKESVETIKEVNLEDDKCALIFTNQLTNLENRFKTKQYIDNIKMSYYNFRKATLYDQKLKDLQLAINEGITQEFDLVPQAGESGDPHRSLPKAHAVFKELFVDNIDCLEQDMMLDMHGGRGAHDALFEHEHELAERDEDVDVDAEVDVDVAPAAAGDARGSIKAKKKARRLARRARAALSMRHDMRRLEAAGKRDALQRLLNAHLRLLCALGMTAQGHQVLQYYRTRGRKPDQPRVTDVRIYNTLLHGYAAEGKYDELSQIMRYAREDGIAPTAQTFAAAFECLQRADADSTPALSLLRREMESHGITLNDLLDKTEFVKDQREMVLGAIKRLEPEFVPEYTPPDIDYTCPLLESLKLEHVENRMGLMTSPAEGLVTAEELKALAKEQFQVEIDGDVVVQNITVTDEPSEAVKLNREKLSSLEAGWRAVVREAFLRNLGTLKSQSNASHSAITLYPYLKVLEVDQVVELIMRALGRLVDGSQTYSPTLKMLQRELGTQLYTKYQIEQYRQSGVLDKLRLIYDRFCEWYIDRRALGGTPLNSRQAWQLLVHRHRDGASLGVHEAPWPTETRQNVGKFLYNIIVNDVKINVNMFKANAKEKLLPAVYKVHRPWGRQVRLELKPHPALARLAAGAPRPLRVRAALLPVRAPSAPWAGPARGAYLLTETPLIRMPFNVIQQSQRLEAAPAPALYPVLDSLNQLGEVPWRINQPILDLQMQVFRNGGNKKLDIPLPPESLTLEDMTLPGVPSLDPQRSGDPQGSGDPAVVKEPNPKAAAAALLRRRMALRRARADMYSLWCDALYKLSLANHYRDSIFWLPHNLDFRGRVYACPPHVSQLGADAARALLLFAARRPLGADGLRWLTLHAVNLTGTMKRNTVEQRLAYAESILPEMLDSAERPLDGGGWWARSEEPWQTLAACMEVRNALRSGNPETYESGFPIHQDGSCNGLQHYAALGGDAAGARAVNLTPCPPRDVYTDTAARVEEMRARDAAAGSAPARALEGFVRRKVIKQTVMTTVYGVTKFGARLQIAKQLKDIDEFPKEHVWPCSLYLTCRTFDSLREMFSSTKLIQDWLVDCAKMISGVCGESVEWTTPLGLPVVQPYFRRAGPTQGACRPPLDYHQRPCTMKQRNAFPPNFIHSLDSSHMMLTSLHCAARGACFVSVHDCFWTHARSVRLMNQICREQFVALHSQPILEDLSRSLAQRYSYPESDLDEGAQGAVNKKRVNKLLRDVPPRGDFQLENVLDSVYFFS